MIWCSPMTTTFSRHDLRFIAIGTIAAIGFGGTTLGAQPSAGHASAIHDGALNGVRLWYRVAGPATSAAAPVVFLHGGPGYSSHSFAVLEGPALERSLTMVYFDQRGSGHSERPASRDYAMSTLVADVEALRVALGVPQITLMGHSFGGILALEYAAQYPEHVARLILVSTPEDVPASCAVRKARLVELHPEVQERAAAVANGCEAEFRVLNGPQHDAFSNAIMFPDSLRRKLQDSIDAVSGLRNTGELGSAMMSAGLLTYKFTAFDRLTMPVLVVAGGADASVGVGPQRAFAASVKGARFIVYEHAGHFVYLDEPAQFARDVIAFATPHK